MSHTMLCSGVFVLFAVVALVVQGNPVELATDSIVEMPTNVEKNFDDGNSMETITVYDVEATTNMMDTPLNNVIKRNKDRIDSLLEELNNIFKYYNETDDKKNLIEFVNEHQDKINPIEREITDFMIEFWEAAQSDEDMKKVDNFWNIPVLNLLNSRY